MASEVVGGAGVSEMVDTTTKAEIEAAVVRFGEAWADGDVTTLETLLSPTYTGTDITENSPTEQHGLPQCTNAPMRARLWTTSLFALR